MEIKTKFNIGDTVYIHLHDHIFITQIKNMKIYCYRDGNYQIEYVVFDNSYSDGETTYPEDKIFATEDECRKSIPIKKNN